MHKFLMTGAALLAVLSLSACGAMQKPAAGQPKVAKDASGEIKETAQIQSIQEFEDISVPAELKRDDELSFVYEAPGVVIGVVTYTGYYKAASIAKFFRAEMPKQGWQFINAFSEGMKYSLTFLKSNRSATISIEEESLSTRVTIKVGPFQAGAGS